MRLLNKVLSHTLQAIEFVNVVAQEIMKNELILELLATASIAGVFVKLISAFFNRLMKNGVNQ